LIWSVVILWGDWIPDPDKDADEIDLAEGAA
jgi:hypothetical protein